ncbi:hypothetical protein PQX77_006524, partial [Marasmius sp. AFHP31]
APHLEHLELDVNRTQNPQENEMQIYAILSSFLFLRTIAIHYDLGIHNECLNDSSVLRMAMRDPEQADTLRKDPKHWRPKLTPEITEYKETYTRIDEHFAKKVWQVVCNRRLEELVLYVGEPNRKIKLGYLAPWIMGEQEIRRCVRVCRNERDDLGEDVSALQISEELRGY